MRPSATPGNWRGGKRVAQRGRRDTHETQSIRILVVRDVFRQVHVKYPITDKLEGIDSNTQKGDDILVLSVSTLQLTGKRSEDIVSAKELEKCDIENGPLLPPAGIHWSAPSRAPTKKRVGEVWSDLHGGAGYFLKSYMKLVSRELR